MCADETGDVGFLRRCAAARDDGRELHREGDELGLVGVEEESEGLAIDEETGVGFVAEELESVVGKVSAFYYGASWVSTRF